MEVSAQFPRTNKEFYSLINNDDSLTSFIVDNNLIKHQNACWNCDSSDLYLAKLNENLIIRCRRCKHYRSTRSDIFKLNTRSSLSICKIIELFWCWSHSYSGIYTSTQTGLNPITVYNWFKKIRNFLYQKMLTAPLMGGKDYIIQIDESLFHGKRKYNKGRVLKGDKKPKNEQGDKNTKKSKKNYGNRVTGPWVLGLVCQKRSDVISKKRINTYNKRQRYKVLKKTRLKSTTNKKKVDLRKLNTKPFRKYQFGSRKYKLAYLKNKSNNITKEVRMFVVEKRDTNTLIPLITKVVAKGSEIVTDEWRSYNSLNKRGYKHFTVNHSENFVDPYTGKHTQLIECLWSIAKYKIMRSMKGTTLQNLPGHLAEQWFRSLHPKDGATIFKCLINEMSVDNLFDFSD